MERLGNDNAPTLDAKGEAQRTCSNDAHTDPETKTLPKVDMSESGSDESLTVETESPTLTEPGKIVYKDEDGNILAEIEIPALNNAGEGENQSKAPTPTTGGTFVYKHPDYGHVRVDKG